MPLIPVTSFDDPRLDPYRNIKDRELARHGGLFIAEGHHIVLRLLESDFPIESLLVDERKLRLVENALRPDVPAYVAPPDLVDQIVGYKFHVGVLACGRRKPPVSLDEVMPPVAKSALLVICPDLRSVENLGSIIRISAGFGANAIILGEESCDPFYRRCVRVSMGTIFSIPIVQSSNILEDLRRLKQKWQTQVVATVIDADAESLAKVARPPRLALMFGSEDQGLSPELKAAADRRVTLPMAWNTDSLNVAVATGIFLYHFTEHKT